MWGKIGTGLGIGAAALAAMVGGGLSYALKRPLPRVRGRLRVAGIQRPVEIVRDRWGVPHIFAEMAEDAFFGQGLVHGQDRLWQLELNRRLGAGRLAGLFGAEALPVDRFYRRLGLRRLAERDLGLLDAESDRYLNAYAAGVNAAITDQGPRLPLEFTILRHRPEPWTPLDSLTWGRVMAWTLSANWDGELLRARILARIGPERAAALEPLYPADMPLIVPPGVDYGALDTSLLEAYRQAAARSPLLAGGGSNNWAVAASRSTTGHALLANDLHLALQVPSIWYEVHVQGGPFDVVGASLPGLPGVIIGHNRDIAWGVTNSFADAQDLYIERLHPDAPHQVAWQGGWEPVQVVREEIQVKGHLVPVVEEVRITRHGPILEPLPAGDGPRAALALRWSGNEPSDALRGVFALNRARNWAEFRQALAQLDLPSQNWVYADTAGNVGYQLAGRVPIRAQGDGLLPVPGWDGAYEWIGYVPADELPSVYNPPEGLVASANNQIVGDDYPYHLSVEYAAGARARRIWERLRWRDQVSPDDCRRLQRDTYSGFGQRLARHIANAGIEPADRWERVALEYLRPWDGYITAESVPACLYEVMRVKLLRAAVEPILGELTDEYLGTGSAPLAVANIYLGRHTPLLLDWLDRADPNWFAQNGGAPRSWNEVLQEVFREMVGELRARFGRDVTQWQWGKLHRASFPHPLGRVKPLDRLFNRGPYPIEGDWDTVCQMAFAPSGSYDVTAWAPSYRQVLDLGDWDASTSIHVPGQSGHPGSPHYADLIPAWRRGLYHPLLFSPDQIRAAAEATLELEPE